MKKRLAIKEENNIDEIIERLQMLGGWPVSSTITTTINSNSNYCYLDDFNNISSISLLDPDEYWKTYTLEEFDKEFPYKTGDFVCIVGMGTGTIFRCSWDYEKKTVMYTILNKDHVFEFDSESLSYPSSEKCQEDIEDEIELPIPEGYKFSMIRKGRIYVKKRQVPKDYEECSCILGDPHKESEVIGYESEILSVFQKLLMARNAYWKFYGNWKNPRDGKEYPSIFNHCGEVRLATIANCVFSFPTDESRDNFHKYFNKDIDRIKDLL